MEVLDNLLLLVGVEDHADDATGKVGLDRRDFDVQVLAEEVLLSIVVTSSEDLLHGDAHLLLGLLNISHWLLLLLLNIDWLGHLDRLSWLLSWDGLSVATHGGEAGLVDGDALLLGAALGRVCLVSVLLLLIGPSIVVLSLRDRKSTIRRSQL